MRKWLRSARLRGAGKIAGGALAVLVAFLAVNLALTAALVFFGNGEFQERGSQTITISDDGDDSVVVTLVLHKLLPEENAAEASVIVYAQGDAMNQLRIGENPCFTISVDDRSADRLFPPRRYPFTCEREAGENFISRETERFLLPAWQSVAMFPFDDVETLPIVRLSTAGNWPRAQYVVAKTLPGRVLAQEGDENNWEIHLRRSANQQIVVIGSALLFLALTMLVSWRILLAERPLSGIQDLLALAGYVVAAVGFRDLLGVDRLAGTSAFEVGAFFVPLVFLVASISITHFRAALAARTPRPSTPRGRGKRR